MNSLDVIALRIRYRRLINTIEEVENRIRITLGNDPITDQLLDLFELQAQTRDWFQSERNTVWRDMARQSYAMAFSMEEGDTAFKEKVKEFQDDYYNK